MKFISRTGRLATLIAAVAATVVAAPAAGAATVPTVEASAVSPTTYHIKAYHSAMAMTVESLVVGAKVYQESPVANDNPVSKRQRWRVVTSPEGLEKYMLNEKIRAFPGGPLVDGCMNAPAFGDNGVTISECHPNNWAQVWDWREVVVGGAKHYMIKTFTNPSERWQIEGGSHDRARLITSASGAAEWGSDLFRFVDAGA